MLGFFGDPFAFGACFALSGIFFFSLVEVHPCKLPRQPGVVMWLPFGLLRSDDQPMGNVAGPGIVRLRYSCGWT
jgi:hypothetical protein